MSEMIKVSDRAKHYSRAPDSVSKSFHDHVKATSERLEKFAKEKYSEVHEIGVRDGLADVCLTVIDGELVFAIVGDTTLYRPVKLGDSAAFRITVTVEGHVVGGNKTFVID